MSWTCEVPSNTVFCDSANLSFRLTWHCPVCSDGSQPSWAPALCSTPEHLRAECCVARSAQGVCLGQRCLVRVNPGGIFHANDMFKTEQPGGTAFLGTRVNTWPCSACAAVRGEGIIIALSCMGAGSLQLT